jgi:hypothetical protein
MPSCHRVIKYSDTLFHSSPSETERYTHAYAQKKRRFFISTLTTIMPWLTRKKKMHWSVRSSVLRRIISSQLKIFLHEHLFLNDICMDSTLKRPPLISSLLGKLHVSRIIHSIVLKIYGPLEHWGSSVWAKPGHGPPLLFAKNKFDSYGIALQHTCVSCLLDGFHVPAWLVLSTDEQYQRLPWGWGRLTIARYFSY